MLKMNKVYISETGKFYAVVDTGKDIAVCSLKTIGSISKNCTDPDPEEFIMRYLRNRGVELDNED